jgi:hypothetical protein
METLRPQYHIGYEAVNARQEELRALRAHDRLASQVQGGAVSWVTLTKKAG